MLPGLLDAETCAFLRKLWQEEELFAKAVLMDRSDFGRGEYRYFHGPVPERIENLRRAMFPFVAAIANEWQQRLGRPDRFPSDWEAFRRQCHEAGQRVPTPILLKYGPGGFNALHRDIRGKVFFPIQLAGVLSPRADATDPDSVGFLGGDFVLCDVPERKKSKRRTLLFCTRDRLVKVGGVFGLQPVQHGVTEITAGSRMVLGIPFHEYR
jgi:hypothetical protein